MPARYCEKGIMLVAALPPWLSHVGARSDDGLPSVEPEEALGKGGDADPATPRRSPISIAISLLAITSSAKGTPSSDGIMRWYSEASRSRLSNAAKTDTCCARRSTIDQQCFSSSSSISSLANSSL